MEEGFLREEGKGQLVWRMGAERAESSKGFHWEGSTWPACKEMEQHLEGVDFHRGASRRLQRCTPEYRVSIGERRECV